MFKMSPEQQKLFDSLTNLHKMVVIEHLNGHTHEEVWKRVRPESKMVKTSVQARVKDILKHPKVKAFIESVNMEKLSDAIMSRDEALQKLSTLARGNMSDLVEFGAMQVGEDANGNPVHQSVWVFKDSALLDPKKLQTIAELAAGREGFKMKIHSPIAAITKLAEMQGWNKAAKVNVDHTSKDGSMSPKEAVIDAGKLSTKTLQELLDARDADE